MLPAQGRARLEVEELAVLVVAPCPRVRMRLRAQQNRRCAEVGAEIVTAGREPESLRVSPLRGAGKDRDADRRAAPAADRLDRRIGAQGRRDPERVMGTPRPKSALGECEGVRPVLETQSIFTPRSRRAS